jgi:flagellar basal body-associated protein FliL
MWTVLIPAVAILLILWFTISRTTSAPSKEQRMNQMDAVSASSYEQTTNHLQSSKVDMGPISGFESPFRVNLYQSYIQ